MIIFKYNPQIPLHIALKAYCYPCIGQAALVSQLAEKQFVTSVVCFTFLLTFTVLCYTLALVIQNNEESKETN